MKTFLTALSIVLCAAANAQKPSAPLSAIPKNEAAPLSGGIKYSVPDSIKEIKPQTSPDNPAMLKLPEGASVEMNIGKMPNFGANVKLDTSSEGELQTTFLQMCVGLDERELDLLNKSYTALLYKYTADGQKGVETLMKMLNGKTAAEIIEIGSPYVSGLPRNNAFDASCEEKFQASLTFAMLALNDAERKELAGAIAKVILRGAKLGKTPEESVKVLHGMSAKDIVEYAEHIHDISLPENL